VRCRLAFRRPSRLRWRPISPACQRQPSTRWNSSLPRFAKVARRTRCWMRQQLGLAEQVPLSTAGANKAGNVGRRPTLHILPRCTRPSSDDRKPIESRSQVDRRSIEGRFFCIEARSKPDWMPIETPSEADQHPIPGETSLDTHSTLTQHRSRCSLNAASQRGRICAVPVRASPSSPNALPLLAPAALTGDALCARCSPACPRTWQ